MTKDRKAPEGPARGADAFGEIEMRLGGLLGELGQAVGDMLGRLEDGTSGEILRSGEIETQRGPIRAEAGIRVRFAGKEIATPGVPARGAPPGAGRRPPDRPAARTGTDLGRPPPAPDPGQTPAPRAIDADIVSGDGHWSLTADLPGVAEDRLTVEVSQGRLILSADGRGRRWAGEFALPDGLTRDDLAVRLRNGVLEISAGEDGT